MGYRRSKKARCALFAAAWLMAIGGWVGTNPADASAQADAYLMVKLGDEAATPGMAGEFLESMSDWLSRNVRVFADSPPTGHIANRMKRATEIVRDHEPRLAFVPPGFYLGHLVEGTRPSEVVAQIPRFGADHTRYYLVVRAGGPASLSELTGARVATTFDYDGAYLERVVFPQDFQPDSEFTLKASDNLADELFALLEGDSSGPDALLFDEELKRFFEDDDFVWSELAVVWTSPPLPPDLVVALGSWTEADVEQLRTALLEMSSSEEGRSLLDLMSSSGFEPVDHAEIERLDARYRSLP